MLEGLSLFLIKDVSFIYFLITLVSHLSSITELKAMNSGLPSDVPSRHWSDLDLHSFSLEATSGAFGPSGTPSFPQIKSGVVLNHTYFDNTVCSIN